MSGRRKATSVLLLSALVLGVAATPATAATSPRPDGWVRIKNFQSGTKTYPIASPWVGDGIYNATGRKQTAKELAVGEYMPDSRYVFEVAVENDGPAGRFKLAATGTGSWTVKYFRGRTDITASIVAGNYETPLLGRGERFVIKVKLWLGNHGETVTRLLTASSVADPTRSDTVRIRMSYTACTC